ncbi:MAG: outer membrane lipoprotein-sorting protein [Pseudomonadota bacterium]
MTIRPLLILAAVAAVATPALAETAEERGLAIAEETERRDDGFGDTRVELTMELRNAQGQSSTRKIRLQSQETNEDGLGDRSLSYFKTPRDVEGTAFLSYTKILEPDDQWLYLPALKRVKRVSSANKSGPFVGSEFAFEDLVSFETAKYDYKFLGEEPCPTDPALTCYVNESYPNDENSGYTKRVSWTDTAEYRIKKVDFYDRKSELLKTLTNDDFRQYLGQFWRSHRQTMVNHQTGKSTVLIFSDFVFQGGVDDAYFNPNRLSRIR